jgi:F0F1-type ATP synthase assembly protein I
MDEKPQAPEQQGSPEPDLPGRQLGMLYTISTALSAPIVIGILIDWQLGTSPWFLLGGTVFGFTAAMVYLVNQAKK